MLRDEQEKEQRSSPRTGTQKKQVRGPGGLLGGGRSSPSRHRPARLRPSAAFLSPDRRCSRRVPVLAVFLMWVEEPRPGTHPAVGGHAAPALSNWPSCCPLSGLLCAGNMLTWREGLTPFSSTTCMWGAIAISHDAPRPRSRGAVQLLPESRAASRWLRPRCTWAPRALSPQLLAAVEPQPSPPRTGRLPPRSWRAACTEIRSASSRGGRAAGGLQAQRPSSMTLRILSHLVTPHCPAMQERGGVFGCLSTERRALLMDFQKLSAFAATVEKIPSPVVLKEK